MSEEELKSLKGKIAIKPLAKGGSNFDTNVLIEVSSTKLQFKPTTGYALFCGAFSLVPAIFLSIGIYNYSENRNFNFLYDNIFTVIIASIFSVAVFFLLREFFKPIVFDKSTNRYYKGFYRNRVEKSKNNIALSRICALQIIGEIVKGDDHTYKSYELNLVLDDATRLNVIDHGNLKGIIQDAKWLSEFLNIPIWHAGSNKKEK